LDYTVFRFFNTYGPKQSDDFVVSKFLKAALDNRDITVYGDGLQTRTFCYIDDNVDACVNAFYRDEVINDVINIGSNKEISILELANTIIQTTQSKSRIVHLDPLTEGDMTRRMPDNSKMLGILGRELLPLNQGIQNILRSLQYAVT
jgi:UDP-glucose 4-epimerase